MPRNCGAEGLLICRRLRCRAAGGRGAEGLLNCRRPRCRAAGGRGLVVRREGGRRSVEVVDA